ncbi:hydrolase, NUDIX family [Bifidobacterium gallicum DSM 20093 = LMG 11596]|nr:hydrolase, NUDIX family [Bifidobacterium gallicum DSM 20093 = LMG 11596]
MRVNKELRASHSGIRMDTPARVVESASVYEGAIFSVQERVVELTDVNNEPVRIHRQVVLHAPAVVMLVHDTVNDRYLIEREYRAGANMFAYGLPAGLIDKDENPEHAAYRELREETGIVPDNVDSCQLDHVRSCYSSEGMSDEIAHIYVMHLTHYHHEPRHFDADEHVESAWVSWTDLLALPISASNSVIAIQHEQLRRVTGV